MVIGAPRSGSTTLYEYLRGHPSIFMPAQKEPAFFALDNEFRKGMGHYTSLFKDARNEEFNSGKAAIGTGPFKFVSWTPKGDLVLERYDGYWRGKAPWQRVIRKEIPNDASRLAALKAGQVDLINYVSASDYQALRRDPKIKTFQGDSVYVMNLQPDQREKTPRVYDNDGKPLDKNPLRDARVREALDLAIDRKTMVEVVLEGLGRPAKQIMPEGFFGSSPRIADR